MPGRKALRRAAPPASLLLIAALMALSCRNAPPAIERADHGAILRMVKAGSAKATIVNVWATWCEPCRKEMPDLLRLRERYRREGFDLILVSADDPDSAETSVRSMLGRFGVDFPTYIEHDSSDEAFINGMGGEWRGALPASFLFGRGGTLRELMVGERSYGEFEQKVTALLK
jgi:thiol-disulfide isomerase/thioredoxin